MREETDDQLGNANSNTITEVSQNLVWFLLGDSDPRLKTETTQCWLALKHRRISLSSNRHTVKKFLVKNYFKIALKLKSLHLQFIQKSIKNPGVISVSKPTNVRNWKIKMLKLLHALSAIAQKKKILRFSWEDHATTQQVGLHTYYWIERNVLYWLDKTALAELGHFHQRPSYYGRALPGYIIAGLKYTRAFLISLNSDYPHS